MQHRQTTLTAPAAHREHRWNLTTVSGAILAHLESSRLEHQIQSYSAAARRLEDQKQYFDKAAADPALWSEFVNRCEDIIAAENASWTAKWSDEK